MRVIFIDQTRKAPKPLHMRLMWYLIGIGAVVAFGVFVFRPDLLLVP